MLNFLRSVASPESEGLAAIEAELRRETDAKKAAIAKLEDLEGARKAAIEAADDDRVDAIDTEIERNERVVERAEIVLPKLTARLQERRAALREANWREHKAKYDDLVAELVPVMIETLRIAKAVLRHSEGAALAGNESRTLAETPAPPFLAPDSLVVSGEHIARFQTAIRGRTGAESPKPKPASPAPRPPARLAPAPTLGSILVRFLKPAVDLLGPAPGAPGETKAVPAEVAENLIRTGLAERVAEAPGAAKRRKLKVPSRAPGPGETEIVIIRSGVELDGEQFGTGERAIVTHDVAERLMRGGAVDLAPPTIAPAPETQETKE